MTEQVFLDDYILFEDEEGANVAVIVSKPEPGERCQVCDRRVNKPRQSSSPGTRRVVTVLPSERADNVEQGLENLSAFIGADPSAYPRGTTLELLLLLGGQHREELKTYLSERTAA